MFEIYASDEDDESQSGTAVISKHETEVERPKMFTVILHNDDFTPMDFVTHVLERFFRKSVAEAQRIMFDVHRKGQGVCGIFTFEVAETKAAMVNDLAKQSEYPLKCTVEEESSD